MQAQLDIFTSKFRDAEEHCIPKKLILERARKYPVPFDIKTRAKIKMKNRLWKKCLQTKDAQTDQDFADSEIRSGDSQERHRSYMKSI